MIYHLLRDSLLCFTSKYSLKLLLAGNGLSPITPVIWFRSRVSFSRRASDRSVIYCSYLVMVSLHFSVASWMI